MALNPAPQVPDGPFMSFQALPHPLPKNVQARHEIGGYWAAGFGGATAHWWKESPSDIRYVRSSCGSVEKVNNIGPEWGRPRCKRCVKSLIAMQEREDEK